MIPVKICGITNLDDACFVINKGASAIGFIFHQASPRYVSPELAAKIVTKMKGEVSFVGVFVNEELDYVNEIAKKVGLDFIQLHGDELPFYCNKIQFPVIKVFRISDAFNIDVLDDYDVHAFLFDTFKKECYGGTGKIFNWNLIHDLNTNYPIILSGGLNEENIHDGIQVAAPDAIDLNSGVENKPGIKNHEKIHSLFSSIANSESMINPFKKSIIKEDLHGI